MYTYMIREVDQSVKERGGERFGSH